MGFVLNDVLVDRVQSAVALDAKDNPLYALTQLADATINITAESTDATDARGSLIKRFYRNKIGEFTANNAMLNVNVVSSASGMPIQNASHEKPLEIPAIKYVPGTTKEITLSNLVEGSVRVNGFGADGALGKAYKSGTAANATDFKVEQESGKVTLPTGTNEAQFQIIYTRTVESGGKITNSGNKFPATIRLLLKALAVDPCAPGTLRAIYIDIPSFQVSPEIEISLAADSQLSYSGTLQADYCSADKALFHIYWAEEDIEEDEDDILGE